MCRDCGCQEANLSKMGEHEHWIDGKLIRHSHTHFRPHSSLVTPARRISLELSVLAKNDQMAKENRTWFGKNHLRVINLISSPGSGKTMLLEKTVEHFGSKYPEFKISILTGDQEKDFDAQRLKASGANVLQLNTLSSCHLDASMIQKELGRFIQAEPGLLIIENVGNLVCPAAFDLGEDLKIALLSTTEGEDKPSKYPLLFREAGVVVITKMDQLPYLDWNLELCEQHIRRVNPTAPILKLSSRSGDGLEVWFEYLREAN